MAAVLLALGAALSYGFSDFLGGVCGKRVSAWSVAAAAGLGGGVFLVVLALAGSGSPTGTDLLWGGLAGIGNGFGTAFLYRGLSSGRMGVVAPVSGVTAAILPVVVGVVSGERPAPLVWFGIAVALPAIWLVAREPASGQPSLSVAPATGSGVVDGILAGLGFGVLFTLLAQVPDTAGNWPLALNQLVGVATIVLIATVLRVEWVPRQPIAWGGAISGVLGGLATLAFLAATHRGLLSVTAVLTSLYPAGTVVLAAALLKERIHRTQLIGLAMCAVTVVCVALG